MKKDHYYRFAITEIDSETGEEKVIHDELHDNCYFLAMDHESDKFTECILNETLFGVAAMIAQAGKGFKLAHLAIMLKHLIDSEKDERFESLEDLLGKAIEGGIQ